MNRKPTKDEQIKSLKQQRAELLETVELQNQRINQLQQEVEEEFLNSPTYQQMKAKIKELQSLQDINDMIIKQQRGNIDQLRRFVTKEVAGDRSE